MDRRTFIFKTSGLIVTVGVLPSFIPAYRGKMDRLAMGTLIMRYRFKQTKPREIETIKNELTLPEVPAYYRRRFGIKKIEFWNEHFESLDPAYLAELKHSIQKAGCQLVNVQLDRISYNLASADEAERQKSISDVKEWIDAVSFLGSTCIRINPGRPTGLIEKSIESFRVLRDYARDKNLIIITANHFGLETDPDKHVRLIKEAGPGIYTEPDFGNYQNPETMYASLAKIVPYAYIVSAKVVDFTESDGKLEHISYDFDKCVRLCESLGFKGTYMVAQWSGKYQDLDYEKVADWVISHIKDNLG